MNTNCWAISNLQSAVFKHVSIWLKHLFKDQTKIQQITVHSKHMFANNNLYDIYLHAHSIFRSGSRSLPAAAAGQFGQFLIDLASLDDQSKACNLICLRLCVCVATVARDCVLKYKRRHSGRPHSCKTHFCLLMARIWLMSKDDAARASNWLTDWRAFSKFGSLTKRARARIFSHPSEQNRTITSSSSSNHSLFDRPSCLPERKRS